MIGRLQKSAGGAVMNPNVRKPNESQKAFRERRKVEAQIEKARAKGRVAWDSRALGTYERKKHGVLE